MWEHHHRHDLIEFLCAWCVTWGLQWGARCRWRMPQNALWGADIGQTLVSTKIGVVDCCSRFWGAAMQHGSSGQMYNVAMERNTTQVHRSDVQCSYAEKYLPKAVSTEVWQKLFRRAPTWVTCNAAGTIGGEVRTRATPLLATSKNNNIWTSYVRHVKQQHPEIKISWYYAR